VGRVFATQAAANNAQAALITLLKSKSADDLAWHKVELDPGPRYPAKWTIEVCSPVMINKYYVPVTARQTWEFAKQFGAFPLTRAIADMTHNYVLKKWGSDYAVEFLSMGAVPLLPPYKGQLDPGTKLPLTQNRVYEYEAFWDSSPLQATKYTSDSSIHTPGVD
jgi:hypothetical protein